jgi:hypothetical protein
MLTKLEYQAGLIKEESTSELLRFTIRQILNQVGNDQIYHYVEQEQQEQKKPQNNLQQPQQQIHKQVILPSTPTTAHQSQVPDNISRRNNLVG